MLLHSSRKANIYKLLKRIYRKITNISENLFLSILGAYQKTQKRKVNSKKIALIGPGIMPIPPKGWGAVEILIWDYYQKLTELGWEVNIINTKDRKEIIKRVNKGNYFFAHLHYDVFYDILDRLNTLQIAFTSHYPHISSPEFHLKDGYSEFFKFMIRQNKYINFVIAEKDKEYLIENGADTNKIKIFRNGASEANFIFSSECELPQKTICLGKILPRKRQSFLQQINQKYDTNIDFVGDNFDENFNVNGDDYRGGWDKKRLYRDLTKYANLVLLSEGEADPLVVKEALISGLGVVVSELAAAYLDKSKKFIHFIPNEKENDMEYIHNSIVSNRNYSVSHRNEIYKYGIENFSYNKVVKEYSNYLKDLSKKTQTIVLVGTGISKIPASGWGAVEGIIWLYYSVLKSMNYNVRIVNNAHRNYARMVREINSRMPDIVHVFYDDRIDLVPRISCKKIFYTTHWAYLPQMRQRQSDPYFKNIFLKAVEHIDKIHLLVISNEIQKIYQSFEVLDDKITVIRNGIDIASFTFNENCILPDRCIYLGKVNSQKRQHLFQNINFMDFAGNISDKHFNTQAKNYLGEWTRDQIYQHLTDYASVILLSDGEADPLTVKEAFAAGCGVVISEYATANLDLDKPWITVIPESKIKNYDEEYIKEAIKKNMEASIKVRKDIRKYAEEKFDIVKIIKEEYLKVIFN